MDNLIHIVGEELDDWEEQASDPKRYSVFTQHLMLAEKISKHEHLTPRSSTVRSGDEDSFYTANTRTPSSKGTRNTASPKVAVPTHIPLTTVGTSTSSARCQKPRKSSDVLSGEWTWRPSIPHRTSSMNTRRKLGNSARQPDLVTFHRRSCQLFTSLDSTISNATAAASASNRTSTSTPPSLTSSVTTQATSILDGDDCKNVHFPSLHLELDDPRLPTLFRQSCSIDSPRLGPRRSSSKLDPHITSTEPIFWNSEASRQAEYAKIDAAHSGFKGFIKKYLPRTWAWAHGKRRDFHQQPTTNAEHIDRNEIDDDSVRRYRISIASATQEAIRSVEIHGVSRGNTPVPFGAEPLASEPRIDLEIGLAENKTKKDRTMAKRLNRARSSDGLAKMFRSNARNA